MTDHDKHEAHAEQPEVELGDLEAKGEPKGGGGGAMDSIMGGGGLMDALKAAGGAGLGAAKEAVTGGEGGAA